MESLSTTRPTRHVPDLKIDEVELITDWDLLQEALFIPQSTALYSACVTFTSTRKWENGIVQRLLQEAENMGLKVFISCIFEVCEPCTRSCLADPKHGNCKGMEISTTTKESYCGGKAHQSDGFYKVQDFLNLLRNNDEYLDAQVFCRAPYSRKGPRVYQIDESIHFVDWAYFYKVTGKTRPPLQDKNWLWLGGLDFGVTFVFGLIALDPYDRAWVVGEYYHDGNKQGSKLLRDHYKGILKIEGIPLINNKVSPAVFIWPDPSANQEILELQGLGLPVLRQRVVGKQSITLGRYNDLDMGVNEVMTRLKLDLVLGSARLMFIKEACPNISREIEGWSHPVDKQGNPVLSEYGDEDHGPDAIRYPLYGLKFQRRVRASRVKGLY